LDTLKRKDFSLVGCMNDGHTTIMMARACLEMATMKNGNNIEIT
jgi:hypothetical protein